MRIWFFTLIAIVLTPVMALAQSFPAFYDVEGVAQTDVLNIRTKPSIGSSIIGTLAADDRAIEVIATDPTDSWAMINIDESSGWVSLKFLKRQAGQEADKLPNPLSCFGTEPFWTMFRPTPTSIEFQWLGEETRLYENVWTLNSLNRTDRHAILADGDKGTLTSVLNRNLCSDGMSDRMYGLNADIFLTGESGVQFFSGCCSISP